MTANAQKYRKELRLCLNELGEHELKALLQIFQELTQQKNKEPVYSKNDFTFGAMQSMVAMSDTVKKVVGFMYELELYDYMQTTASLTGAHLIRLLTMMNENEAAGSRMRAIPFEPKPYKD